MAGTSKPSIDIYKLLCVMKCSHFGSNLTVVPLLLEDSHVVCLSFYRLPLRRLLMFMLPLPRMQRWIIWLSWLSNCERKWI
jgi:hypothetical protein